MNIFTFINILQIVIALGIVNVWFLRPNKSTPYRAKQAKTMKQEFKAYGFSSNFMYFIGFLKVVTAGFLLAGIWYPQYIFSAALVMSALMLGAVSMHIKVRDSLKKTFPAFLMLGMSVAILILL